jgi:V-type H+-transporting ATPase subunit F
MGKKRLITQKDLKVAVIGDEQTVAGLVLGGMGAVDGQGRKNFFVVGGNVRAAEIAEAFHEYVNRKDVAIVLISQSIANQIRNVVDDFARSGRVTPAILEMPSKDLPYDAKKDPIMQRVQLFFGTNPVM